MAEVQRCPRACGEVVLWVLTHGGHRRALNPDPHPTGTVTIETLPNGTIRGRMLPGDELPAQCTAYVLHDRTCPKSPENARLRAVATARCLTCRSALDAVLAGLGGWYGRWHPCCAPAVRTARQEIPA